MLAFEAPGKLRLLSLWLACSPCAKPYPSAFRTVPTPVLLHHAVLHAGTVEDALLRWLRAAELTCDRAALLVAQDPAVVIGALMKLAGGSPAFAHELSVDAFLQQVIQRSSFVDC